MVEIYISKVVYEDGNAVVHLSNGDTLGEVINATANAEVDSVSTVTLESRLVTRDNAKSSPS